MRIRSESAVQTGLGVDEDQPGEANPQVQHKLNCAKGELEGDVKHEEQHGPELEKNARPSVQCLQKLLSG